VEYEFNSTGRLESLTTIGPDLARCVNEHVVPRHDDHGVGELGAEVGAVVGQDLGPGDAVVQQALIRREQPAALDDVVEVLGVEDLGGLLVQVEFRGGRGRRAGGFQRGQQVSWEAGVGLWVETVRHELAVRDPNRVGSRERHHHRAVQVLQREHVQKLRHRHGLRGELRRWLCLVRYRAIPSSTKHIPRFTSSLQHNKFQRMFISKQTTVRAPTVHSPGSVHVPGRQRRGLRIARYLRMKPLLGMPSPELLSPRQSLQIHGGSR
jgi:hypothetical protein